MKKMITIPMLLFFLIGCGNGLRHHMALNDEKGFDTSYDVGKKELKIAGWNEPFILFFFSTLCGACTEQVPSLNTISKEYEGKIKVIGVMGDSLGLTRDIDALHLKDVKFMSISNKKSVDYFSNIVGGVMGTPVTYIFDKDGKIVKTFLGLYPKSAFVKELKLLLN